MEIDYPAIFSFASYKVIQLNKLKRRKMSLRMDEGSM